MTTFFGGLARIIEAPWLSDARGSLMPLEFDLLPFPPRRVFTVSGVPEGTVRGGHGHRSGMQLLFCLAGRIGIEMRHGGETLELALAADGKGLLFGPGIWCRQTYLAGDSTLLALASEPYDPDSYFDDAD